MTGDTGVYMPTLRYQINISLTRADYQCLQRVRRRTKARNTDIIRAGLATYEIEATQSVLGPIISDQPEQPAA